MEIEEQVEECVIRKVLHTKELRRYDKERVISQIFLKQYTNNKISPSINITELEDKVEVFRYNLDHNQIRLFFYNLGFTKEISKTTYFGIMPKKEYHNLFNFLERKKVWETNLYKSVLDIPSTALLISKNQRKHAFEIDSIYDLILLKKTSRHSVTKILALDSNLENRDVTLRFLDISKKIYSVSKKYIKTKV